MVISSLLFVITGGTGGVPPPPSPPTDKGVPKEWVKKRLEVLGRILARLANKTAAALPRIIGSIISWLFSLLAKTTGWLAKNLLAVFLAIGKVLLLTARDFILSA